MNNKTTAKEIQRSIFGPFLNLHSLMFYFKLNCIILPLSLIYFKFQYGNVKD